jgi:hypothetical protein
MLPPNRVLEKGSARAIILKAFIGKTQYIFEMGQLKIFVLKNSNVKSI